MMSGDFQASPEIKKSVSRPAGQSAKIFRVQVPVEQLNNRIPTSPAFIVFFSLMKIIFPLQVAFILPFLIYMVLDKYRIDITFSVYPVIVIALGLTAYLIFLESLFALREEPLPSKPVSPYPPATAIVAAYLPNEVDVILPTLQAMLKIQYPAPFQIILAYNTPTPLPIERVLMDLARYDTRLVLLHVVDSSSKAQNVNAALDFVSGEFVGIFDADHHPEPDTFTRAWLWLSQGYDVVQGHCVIRNGSQSWVARLAAVDFELIYSLSHSGRARMHHFGVFGGSNGYWRTDVLRQVGMRRSMLTEDIDASIRALRQGYRFTYDPHIVSRELAPLTLKAFWNQRMRWAQGWSQVSFKQALPALFSFHLSIRQKLGILNLLCWREFYIWISVQIIPIVAFQLVKGEFNWFSPLFLLASLFILCISPFQALLAYAIADSSVKKHGWWFISYAFLSFFFFSELKNHIARIAHMREIFGEHEWKVTPRSTTHI